MRRFALFLLRADHRLRQWRARPRHARLRRGGAYSGRLAFDSDSGFHIDSKGRKVVLTPEGWRYARRGDLSHYARFHRQVRTIENTAMQALPDAHHVAPTPDDAHYDADAPNRTRLVQLRDAEAPVQTSHTEASYRHD